MKLGAKQINDAAETLIKFKDKVDIKKWRVIIMILTGAELSYIREDGVYVVSIGILKN